LESERQHIPANNQSVGDLQISLCCARCFVRFAQTVRGFFEIFSFWGHQTALLKASGCDVDWVLRRLCLLHGLVQRDVSEHFGGVL
jgi:hypothetical protein